MGNERLISLFRKAAEPHCCAERLLGSGVLTQVFQKHLAASGSDIRKVTRKQLLAMKAPIKAAKKRTGAGPSFARWANLQQTHLRSRSGAASAGRQAPLGGRDAYRARMAALSTQWRQGNGLLQVPRPRDRQDHDSGVTYADRIGTALFGMSSVDTPLLPDLAREQYDATCPPADGRVGGLTERFKPLRQTFRTSCHVHDSGAIPKASTFSSYVPCGRLHPGVCRNDLSSDIIAANAQLRKVCVGATFVTFAVVGRVRYSSSNQRDV